jgi:hypothetical protein
MASRPKLGKSWLLLQIGAAVASGTVALASEDGQPPPSGDVLHLALEDSERRLQRRLTKYFGARRECWPARLKLATNWRRLDQGGLDDLRGWCKSVTKPVLIVIDVLKKLRKPKQRAQTDYDADYEAFEELIKLAREFSGLTIMAAHHDRKMDAEDVFDTASGTLGLTGGVDTIALLKRNKQGVTLHIRGRDLLDDVEKAVNFDRETCRWMVLGEAAEVQRSAQRARVKAALKDEPDGLGVAEIVGRAQLLNRNAADLLLGKMAADGEIERIKRGVYGLPGTRSNLSLRKNGQKDRKKPKPLNLQGDDHLSVDLSQSSQRTDSAARQPDAPVPPPAPTWRTRL